MSKEVVLSRLLALVLVMIGCASALSADEDGPLAPSQSKPYNVLLISLDTLRADHLHCYGYPRETSPSIDEVAAQGVLFEDVSAASSWTVPSHMSMFTGLYPSVHGVEDLMSTLGQGVPTLAEVLQDNGYSTGGFVTGASLNGRFGFNRGFQSYDDFTVTLSQELNLFEDQSDESSSINQSPTNSSITTLATKWLEEHSEEKFFLFLHYWDIHYDYVPPPPCDRLFDPDYTGPEDGRDIMQRRGELEASLTATDREHLIALYDGEIRHTDAHVGKILALLDELDLARNTLVVIVSDHGEEFMEHGHLTHGRTLFEEVIHIPWILRLPGHLPAGRRVKGNVSHVDLMPTILGLLDVEPSESVAGVDLTPTCLGATPVPRRLIFSELQYNFKLRAVRSGPYKCIQEEGDVAMPLMVVKNGIEQAPNDEVLPPEQQREMKAFLVKGLRAGPGAAARPENLAKPSDASAETLRQLRNLGYSE